MALRRYTRSIDGTIPIPALLYNDEELLASQDNVGIYDGPQKAPNHQSGWTHVSTHRLFYVDTRNELSHSFAMDLSCVTQTEYYAGLFKSSPKVTLHVASETPLSGQGAQDAAQDAHDASESWECQVCSYRNPPGLSPAAARICALCGVPRSAVPSQATTHLTPPHHQHLSSSLPSTPIPSGPSPTLPSDEPGAMGPDSSISCPACTFLNHPSLHACEMCGSSLPRRSARTAARSAPTSRPASPDVSEDEDDEPRAMFIKLSFRKGGDKAFYAVLKRSLKAKGWEASGVMNHSIPTRPPAAAGDDPANNSLSISRSGIHGILQGVETTAQSQESGMKDALQDLEALMVKAKDMVRLAAELNERLTATSTTAAAALESGQTPTLIPSTEPEEATFIRSSLSQLGLQMANTPVTLDMIRDERKWISELARELGCVLQGDGKANAGIMKHRGIVALDEVWGGWNRARGIALIPPSTFLQVLPELPAHTSPPIRMRIFPSGLSVLHTPPYTHASFTARLAGLLALSGPKTTMEVAQEEAVAVAMAAEMIDAVESEGHLCRDDPSGAAIRSEGSGAAVELRWWTNPFRDYVWDGCM